MTSFATTTDGSRVAYATAGRPWRPALVLTHSLGSDHHMWDPQIEALKSQYFVVAVDHLGHGESDVPSGACTIADFGTAVLAAADAAELDRFHYCGLSVGGIIGLWLGVNHPDRLLSLSLCNTAARVGDPQRWQERIDVATTSGMSALVDSVIACWFSEGFAERQPDHYAAARATLLATDPDGYAAMCAALRDGDLRESAPTISVPTLIIGGLLDQSTTIEQSRWLHEQIAGSRLVELPAAHLSNLDAEAEFTKALDHFLGEMTPP